MPDPQQHAPRGPLVLRDLMGAPDPMGRPVPQRCTAKSKQTGQQCKQRVVPGAVVCHYHGGAAPQVKEKAEERLKALVHPAISRLGQLVEQTEFPSVAIAAVKDVLDRNLGKAIESVHIAGNDGGPLQIVINAPWRKALKE